MNALNKIKFICLAILFVGTITSCKKFVAIDAPRTALIKTTVFASDVTANAAILDLYTELSLNGFSNGSASSISYLGTLLSDEQIHYMRGAADWDIPYQQFNENQLLKENSKVLELWTSLYKCLYKANAIIEGLAASSGVSPGVKVQLEGEAKFIRAFCHFYLVNLWGDVPLVLTTDYRANSTVARTPIEDVYTNIVTELKEVQNLLPADYAFANDERVRANKWVATALLARVYLYREQWADAETQASAVISNPSYSLKANPGDVFFVNSTEAILQWWSQNRPYDRGTFRIGFTPSYASFRPAYATSFEANDQRSITWVNLNGSGYYNVRKYNAAVDLPPAQYSTVLRLAEQYLIRAEARAKLNKLTGANSAESDINTIRNRAGLSNTTATTQAQLLLAIEQERKAELFTEWGHRWFDLNRTGRAAAVIGAIKTTWQPTDKWLPLPESEVRNNPSLTQNQGY